jgi:NADP-dependent 3-hydroxy acid dehydrogenase YdfG
MKRLSLVVRWDKSPRSCRPAGRLTAQHGGHFVVLASVAGDCGCLRNCLRGSTEAALHLDVLGLRVQLFSASVTVTMSSPALSIQP